MQGREIYVYRRTQYIGGRAVLLSWDEGARELYPIARKLREEGCRVEAILGFSHGKEVEMECEYAEISDRLIVYTPDGSRGARNDAEGALRELLRENDLPDALYVSCPVKMWGKIDCLLRR